MIKRNFLRAASITFAASVLGQRRAFGSEVKLNGIHKGTFGSCCKDLSDAMTKPPNKFFFVETNQVLYLTVGYMQTEKGPGWFDQAVIYCPFCGKQLQSREDIARKAHG